MSGMSKSPGFSLAAQFREVRAKAKRLARKTAERDLIEAKERLRLAELDAQTAGILKRGKESNR